MFIAPFWSRANVGIDGAPSEDGPIIAFGWSFRSQLEADERATEKARKQAERFRTTNRFEGVKSGPRDYYNSGERPLREPILERLGSEDDPWGLITRNGYGTRVLNTARALFIDVDLPERPRDSRTFWQRLRGVPAPQAKTAEDIEAQIRSVASSLPDLALRLYRTPNGFRLLVTNRLYTPGSDEVDLILEAFGSDPLYRQLCTNQHCFRARLGPKPWRMGLSRPPNNWFPFHEDPKRRAQFEDWLAIYAEKCHQYDACHFVGLIGPSEVHPELSAVIEVHDREAVGEGHLA